MLVATIGTSVRPRGACLLAGCAKAGGEEGQSGSSVRAGGGGGAEWSRRRHDGRGRHTRTQGQSRRRRRVPGDDGAASRGSDVATPGRVPVVCYPSAGSDAPGLVVQAWMTSMRFATSFVT